LHQIGRKKVAAKLQAAIAIFATFVTPLCKDDKPSKFAAAMAASSNSLGHWASGLKSQSWNLFQYSGRSFLLSSYYGTRFDVFVF
jgi:hypothetical protein